MAKPGNQKKETEMGNNIFCMIHTAESTIKKLCYYKQLKNAYFI
jgi:hypothetical protein